MQVSRRAGNQVDCRLQPFQGFFGAFLIRLAFSTLFLMFGDGPARVRATMIAGVMTMLAPTLGPMVGGFITDQLSWHWLFLINVPVGFVVTGGLTWLASIDAPKGLGLAGSILRQRRCLVHPAPLVRLSAFRRRNFTLDCALSFTLAPGYTARHFYCRCFLVSSAITTLSSRRR